METSSLLSSLVLAGFFLAFAYLSLALKSVPSRGRRLSQPEAIGHVLRLLQVASILAISLSALALLVSQGVSPRWFWVTLVSLGVLGSVAGIDWLSAVLARRHTGAINVITTPLCLVLAALARGGRLMENAVPTTASGNVEGLSREGSQRLDSNEPVITEEEQAALDTRERSMVRSIIRLDESTVRMVMVPRVDILAVEINDTLADVAHLIVEGGHSRLPVYSDTLDAIEGIVHVRDLLPILVGRKRWPPLRELIRPAFFTPESKRLDDLLEELQEKRIQMAIVVDEYGGTEGLVTLEDLLEEIVGEIEDEFSASNREPQVVPAANGELLVDANVPLDYISDLLSVNIAREGVDTIGALVYGALGKIPESGDEVVLDGVRVKVVSLLGRRLRKLRVSKG